MLIKSSYLISLIWLASFSFSAAQATAGRNIDDHLLIKEAEKAMGGKVYENIEGTPYLNDAFKQGEVFFDKGRHALPVRYNIYDDWIEYQQNNQTYILDADARIKKVRFDDYTFIVEKYESKGKIKRGYFTMLDSGKVMLLSKKIVTYRERQDAKALESGSTPAKYSRASDTFYYKIGNGELLKVENLKNMVASFPDKQEELNHFVKKEKISPRKEEELRKLVRYYNSL